MTKSNKVGIILSFVLSFAIFLGGGLFCALYFGNHFYHNEVEAKVDEPKVEEEARLASTAGLLFAGGPEFVQGSVHIQFYVAYDSSMFSSVSVSSLTFSPQVGGMVFFNGPAFSANLQSGCSWAANSFSSVCYYRSADSSFISASSFLYSSWSQTGSYTFTRSDNSFSDSGINLRSYVNQAGYWTVVIQLKSSIVTRNSYNMAYADSADLVVSSSYSKWNVVYDSNLISAISISPYNEINPQAGLRTGADPSTITVSLKPGYTWKASSFIAVTYYYWGADAYPSVSSWKSWNLFENIPFSRNGDAWSGTYNVNCAFNVAPTNAGINHFICVVEFPDDVIQAPTPVAKPTHSGGTSHVYTSNQITHGVTGFETTYMTRSGTYQATNAGNYSITYTLKSGYCWSDNSTSPVVLNWSITQATNSWTSQPSISSWTYGSAPSTVNVGRPMFCSNLSFFHWGVVNADIFETYYIVDELGLGGFDLVSDLSDLQMYVIGDYQSYPMISLHNDSVVLNQNLGYDAYEEEITSCWATLPPGRYYFTSFMSGTSINYTNVHYETEFYVYAPAPTVTNTTFTYNGNNQGPTISGSTTYYSTYGTTTAKNAGSYGFYIQAKYGTDTYSGYTYPYYFNGHGDMDYFLNDWGYNSLAECYSGEGWSRNVYYASIVDYLGSLCFSVGYTINKASLNGGSITLTPTEYTYDGTVHKP